MPAAHRSKLAVASSNQLNPVKTDAAFQMAENNNNRTNQEENECSVMIIEPNITVIEISDDDEKEDNKDALQITISSKNTATNSAAKNQKLAAKTNSLVAKKLGGSFKPIQTVAFKRKNKSSAPAKKVAQAVVQLIKSNKTAKNNNTTHEQNDRSLLLIEPDITIIEISDDDEKENDKNLLQMMASQVFQSNVAATPNLIKQEKKIVPATLTPKQAVTAKNVARSSARKAKPAAKKAVPATPSLANKSHNPFKPLQKVKKTAAVKRKFEPPSPAAAKANNAAKRPCPNGANKSTPSKPKRKINQRTPPRASLDNSYIQSHRNPRLCFDIVDLSNRHGRITEPKKQRLLENTLRWYFQQLPYRGDMYSSVFWSSAWKDGYFRVECADENSSRLLFDVPNMISDALWSGCVLFVVPSGSVRAPFFNGRRCIALNTNRELPGTPEKFLALLGWRNRQFDVHKWTAIRWTYQHPQFGPMYFFLVDNASYSKLLNCNGGIQFGLGQMLYFNLRPHDSMYRDSLYFRQMMHWNYQ